jgi:hypothetical protein
METNWHRVRLPTIARRVSPEMAPDRRWAWCEREPGVKRLRLRSPKGRIYEFAMNRGAWVRKVSDLPSGQ